MTEPSEGVSFTITFDEVHKHKLEALILRTGVKDLSELIKESMVLFDWAVEQVESGNRIASYNAEKHCVHTEKECIPSLMHITALRDSLKDECD